MNHGQIDKTLVLEKSCGVMLLVRITLNIGDLSRLMTIPTKCNVRPAKTDQTGRIPRLI